MLREESVGDTAHSEYIADCLQDGFDLPVGLVARLLGRKLKAYRDDQNCFLIQGFPADVEQLIEFERKVSNLGISLVAMLMQAGLS
jgi:adenylate kinase family enzyme